MSLNRIAKYGQADPQIAHFNAAGSETRVAIASGRQFVALGPANSQLAQWQAQIFRWAYQQAVADLAPPEHFRRFFSVWN